MRGVVVLAVVRVVFAVPVFEAFVFPRLLGFVELFPPCVAVLVAPWVAPPAAFVFVPPRGEVLLGVPPRGAPAFGLGDPLPVGCGALGAGCEAGAAAGAGLLGAGGSGFF